MAKQALSIRERKPPHKRIDEIPVKIVDASVDEAVRMSEEYWRENGSREDWYCAISVDSGCYF